MRANTWKMKIFCAGVISLSLGKALTILLEKSGYENFIGVGSTLTGTYFEKLISLIYF